MNIDKVEESTSWQSRRKLLASAASDKPDPLVAVMSINDSEGIDASLPGWVAIVVETLGAWTVLGAILVPVWLFSQTRYPISSVGPGDAPKPLPVRAVVVPALAMFSRQAATSHGAIYTEPSIGKPTVRPRTGTQHKLPTKAPADANISDSTTAADHSVTEEGVAEQETPNLSPRPDNQADPLPPPPVAPAPPAPATLQIIQTN